MFMRTVLILLLTSISGSIAIAEDPIALYGNETISGSDLRHIAKIAQYPYGDPGYTFSHTADTNERDDAKQYVQTGAEEIVWGRHNARLARSSGITPGKADTAKIGSGYYECIGDAYDSQVRDQTRRANSNDLSIAYGILGDQLVRPEMREVAYLCRFTSAPAETPENTKIRDQLDKVRGDVLEGRLSFEDAAIRYSEAPSAGNGGRIGTIRETEQLNPKFMSLAFSMTSNTISRVQRLHNGYYIVRVGAVYPREHPTLDQVKRSQDLRITLLNLAAQTSISEVLAVAKRKYPKAQTDNEAMGLLALERGFRPDDCDARRELAELYELAMDAFAERHRADIISSEAEIEQYYAMHKEEMHEEGIWRVTKVLIPPESRKSFVPRSRDAAAKIATVARTSLQQGTSLDAMKSQFKRDDIQVIPPAGWIQGTGDAKADESILKMNAGEVTPVFIGEDGAYFFRIESKRQMPLRSLEAERQNIVAILNRNKFDALREAERKALAAKLQLRILWDKF